MSSRQKYLLASLLILLFGGFGVYYSLYSIYTSSYIPLANLPPPPPGAPVTYAPPPPPAPSFSVFTKDKRTVVVTWSNLPSDATALNIYRAKKGAKGTLWQTIEFGSGDSAGGSKEFKLKSGDDANSYSYYGQTTGGGGSSATSTGWTSDPIPPQPFPTSTVSSPPTGGGSSGGSSSTPPADSGSNPPPPPPPQNPTPTPTSTTYYPPDGQSSTTATEPPATFGVQHTNRNIDIYWNGLPAGTDEITIYRADQSSGPWMKLLNQRSPLSSGSIYLVDYSINQTFYYRMDALANGTITHSYGPVMLPPLQ